MANPAKKLTGGDFTHDLCAGPAEPNESQILCAAVALAPRIRAAADELERRRQLPRSIVDGLRDVGAFGMVMPRAWKGPELDPLIQFRVLEHWPSRTARSASAP